MVMVSCIDFLSTSDQKTQSWIISLWSVSAATQNHAQRAWKKSTARDRGTCIANQSRNTESNLFRHLQRLAFTVKLVGVITLRRFQGCAEKDESVIGKMMGYYLKQGLWILQVFSQHGCDNSLIGPAAVSQAQLKGILNFKCNSVMVSGDGAQAV